MFDITKIKDDLLERECQIGDTTFSIGKMPTIEGWDCMEVIREQTGMTIMNLKDDSKDSEDPRIAVMKAIVKIFFTLPVPFVKKLKIQLFSHCQYKNEQTTWSPLKQVNMQSAFGALEPIAVYEVLVRCLAVNFTVSCQEIIDLISGIGFLDTNENQP